MKQYIYNKFLHLNYAKFFSIYFILMMSYFIYYDELYKINECVTSSIKVCFPVGMIIIYIHIYIKDKHFNKEKTFRLRDLFAVFLLGGVLFNTLIDITC